VREAEEKSELVMCERRVPVGHDLDGLELLILRGGAGVTLLFARGFEQDTREWGRSGSCSREASEACTVQLRYAAQAGVLSWSGRGGIRKVRIQILAGLVDSWRTASLPSSTISRLTTIPGLLQIETACMGRAVGSENFGERRAPKGKECTSSAWAIWEAILLGFCGGTAGFCSRVIVATILILGGSFGPSFAAGAPNIGTGGRFSAPNIGTGGRFDIATAPVSRKKCPSQDSGRLGTDCDHGEATGR